MLSELLRNAHGQVSGFKMDDGRIRDDIMGRAACWIPRNGAGAFDADSTELELSMF
jgi:hypothetical protein